MTISINDDEYMSELENLKGIFFRAPVFLRIQSGKPLSVQEQLAKEQWSSFLRNLIIFRKAVWINYPVSTYRAENKLFQLCCAKEAGLSIPRTNVSNCASFPLDPEKEYIVKSLDTALFYDVENGKEMFIYSNVVSGLDLQEYDLSSAPVFIQEFLNPKVDCRVTYVQGKLFPVKILKDGHGIRGDWRTKKEDLEYTPFQLPAHVEDSL